MTRWPALALTGLLLLAGCLGGSPPPARTFEPPLPLRPAAPVAEAADLRLERVLGAPHLEERLVWRKDPLELGYREEERWSAPPASYLEEALGRELFQRRGLRRVETSAAPGLSVTLERLEEVVAPAHRVRARLHAVLLDAARAALLEVTLEEEVAVSEDTAEAVVEASGRALDGAIQRLVAQVLVALGRE